MSQVTNGDLTGTLMAADTTPLIVKYATINAASNGNNTIVAAVTAKKIRVISLWVVSAGTVTTTWQTAAGGTGLSGAASLAANTGYVLPHNKDGWFETVAGQLLNLSLSAGIQVSGSLSYVEI